MGLYELSICNEGVTSPGPNIKSERTKLYFFGVASEERRDVEWED